MDARTRFETRTVGGLPVVQAFLEELEFAQTIDEVVPWEGDVPGRRRLRYRLLRRDAGTVE
jgi:hypothetical protein